MRRGIGQRIDDLQLLDDRARPSMSDDNRQRSLFFRTDVNEMDVQPVDIRDELRIAIELRLDLAPIVFRRPIAGELLHRRERHALREIGNGLFFGPPRRFDPLAEIREVLVRGVKLEGADGVCCGLSCGVERRHGAGHCGLLLKGAPAATRTKPQAAYGVHARYEPMEGESIGRWYRQYVGITAPDESE